MFVDHLEKFDRSMRPVRGDVFEVVVNGVGRLCRVMRPDVETWWAGKVAVVYVFRTATADWDGRDRSVLATDNLAGPPLLVMMPVFRRKYLRLVAHLDVEEGEELSQHCFAAASGDCVDEYGNDLPERVEPRGVLGPATEMEIVWTWMRCFGWDPASVE